MNYLLTPSTNSDKSFWAQITLSFQSVLISGTWGHPPHIQTTAGEGTKCVAPCCHAVAALQEEMVQALCGEECFKGVP